MLVQEQLCPNCFEAITDPICNDCLSNHFEYWLGEVDKDATKKTKAMEKIKSLLAVNGLNEDKCIICNKKALNLCPHCFSVKVADTLRNLGFPTEVIENFEYLFSDKSYARQEEDEFRN